MDNRIVLCVIPIMIVGLVVGKLISAQKWYYLLGLIFAFAYVGFALRHQWEILLVLIFFVDLIWGYVMRRGFHLFFDFPWEHSLVLLFATVILYIAWRNSEAPGSEWKKSPVPSEFKLIVLFIILLIMGAFSWPKAHEKVAYEWVRFGLAGLGAFMLGHGVGCNPERARRFSAALFVLLVLVSLEISARMQLGFELIPVNLGYEDYQLHRLGITGRYYLPVFAGKSGDGLLMAIALALGLGTISNSSSRLWKVACGVGLTSVISVWILSLDRSAWLAGTAALTLWSLILLRQPGSRRIGFVIACLIMAEFTALLIIGEKSRGDLGQYFSELISSDRYLLWYSTIRALPQFPLLGIGYRNLDQFAWTLHQAVPYVPYKMPLDDTWGQYVQPHNSYLDLMTFGGIPTFIIFVIFLGGVLKRGRRSFQVSDNKDFRITLFTVYSALLVLCIFSLFNQHLWVWPTNLLFWILSGIVVGLSQVVEQDSPESQASSRCGLGR